MRRSVIVPTLMTVVLAACVTGGYRTHTEYDRVLGRTVTRVTKNVIGGFNPFGDNVTLNPMVVSDDAGRRFYLAAQWLGDDWIFIKDGQSLDLLVDGDRMSLTGSVTTQDVDLCSSGGCNVDERANYSVTADQLRAISVASQVIMRLQGRRGYVERTFTAANMNVFRSFVAEHVGAQLVP